MEKAKFVKNPCGRDTLKITCNLSTYDILIQLFDIFYMPGICRDIPHYYLSNGAATNVF